MTGCGAERTAARRGRTILYASGADFETVNPLITVLPLAKQVERYLLLTTLARYDTALVPQPYLARAWRFSPDGTVLTFTLRTGLRWDDGLLTTARDVAWTLNAARDPATGYPRLNDLAGIVSVNDPNDSTVVIRYGSPVKHFPDVLTDLAILPAHLFDTLPHERMRSAGWNERPVGNGPFRFVLHQSNRRWVFQAKPDFPADLGGPAHLDRFIVVVVDQPSTKLAALTSGELDFAGIFPAHASYVRKDPNLAVISYPLLFTYGLVFNTRRPPFDRRQVRLAAALALDRREIVDGYLYGFATPADGPVPPDLPGYLPVPPLPLAPDSARRLLGGRRVPFELLTVGSGEAALEQMIQARLDAVGFDVRIRQLELSAFLDRVQGPLHEFDAAVMGVQGDFGLGYLSPLLALTGMRGPTDPARLQKLFRDSLPVAFLYHGRGLAGMNARVRGVRMDVRGELASVIDWQVGP